METNEGTAAAVELTAHDQQRLRERIHRLRNVLGTISAFGELLALEPLSEKGRGRAERIVSGVMEARELIDEIHSAVTVRPQQ